MEKYNVNLYWGVSCVLYLLVIAPILIIINTDYFTVFILWILWAIVLWGFKEYYLEEAVVIDREELESYPDHIKHLASFGIDGKARISRRLLYNK